MPLFIPSIYTYLQPLTFLPESTTKLLRPKMKETQLGREPSAARPYASVPPMRYASIFTSMTKEIEECKANKVEKQLCSFGSCENGYKSRDPNA